MINLFGLSLVELSEWFESLGEKPFRGRQLFRWMYQRGEWALDAMTDLSKTLQEKIKNAARISVPQIEKIEQEESTAFSTKKLLFRLEDGYFIEAVYIPDAGRHTVCLSSQVGCGLGCEFCATATMGWKRNLSVGEIVGQYLQLRKTLSTDITNVVMMGMGEPFANYDAVMRACEILTHPDGGGLGRKKITISTAGLVPEILRFTEERRPYSLAVSLNATTDELRQKLMPIARKYPLKELMEALRNYNSVDRNRVTLEYVLIGGINDTEADAHRLKRIVSFIGRCKVNLILFNPVAHSPFRSPDEETVEGFLKILSVIHSPLTLRKSRGTKISAACGQLAVNTHNDRRCQTP